jgi:hypothetical protein
MKKKFLFALIWAAVLCLFAGVAQAAPWLICDYDAYATKADIEIDGAVANGTTPVSVLIGWVKADGKLTFTDPGAGSTRVTVLWDMSAYPSGTHNVRARFNDPPWGVSGWSDPFVPPGRPGGKPSGVRMAAQ